MLAGLKARLRDPELLAAFIHEFGVEMYRAKLRRDDPNASDETISRRVTAWLQEPPPVEPPFRITRRFLRANT